jgi:hypothetical protein
MAYSQNNLFRVGGGLSAQSNGKSLWFYVSTDDFATVKASGYLSNAFDMGVRAGDPIFVIDTDASPPTVTLAAIATCTNAPACTMAQTGVVPST